MKIGLVINHMENTKTGAVPSYSEIRDIAQLADASGLDAFGFPYDHRFGRFQEAIQIIKPLLDGETVTFSGQYYQAQDCVITPPGPRVEGARTEPGRTRAEHSRSTRTEPGRSIPLLIGCRGPRMMRLTARYADQWNTAWLSDVGKLSERLEPLHAACAEVGRDPATLAITAGVDVAFPDLGQADPYSKNPHSGSAEELAQSFQEYDAVGAAHLIVHLSPLNTAAIERLATAVRLYRG